MSTTRINHICTQSETIKEIQKKIHSIEIEQVSNKKDINTIKEDINEMKNDIKEVGEKVESVNLKVESGNNRLFLTLIISGAVLLVGIFAEKVI